MEPPRDIRDRTFDFACEAVRFARKLAKTWDCRRIASQLMNAATSVAANAEEAKGAYSRREFAVKNCIALKEAREARLWLRIITTCQLAPLAETEPLLRESGELVGILTATVRTARQPRQTP